MTTTHRTAPPFARATTAILALAALLALMIGPASPAQAHARLETSSPKGGSTLTATPPEIMLRFNEPIEEGLNQVSVRTGSTDVTQGELQVDGSTVYQPIKSSLPAGDYTVAYKVVSADGHPISGSFSFTYAPPGGDTGAGGGATSGSATSEGTTSGGTTSDAPTSSADGSATSDGGATSDDPTTGGATTSTPDDSATGSGSATSEPTSTSSAPSSQTTSSASPSTSATSGDGESEPSDSTSSSAAAPVDADDTSGSGGTPGWVWPAAIGAALVVMAGLGLALRGRGSREDDEEIALEEWRG